MRVLAFMRCYTMEQNLISKNTVKARVWTKLKPVRAQTKLTD
jgi:hypothetical protein